jgi:ankyrin repeat protein
MKQSWEERKLTLQLRRALDNQDFEAFSQVIQEGADPSSLYYDLSPGGSILSRASDLCLTEYVKFLLMHQADTEMEDYEGETAIIKAAFKGFADVVDLLIIHGANVNHRSRSGWSALDFARVRQRKISSGTNIFEPDPDSDYLRTIDLLTPHTSPEDEE